MDELQTLTRWGQAGYDISLRYGIESIDSSDNYSIRYKLGWVCTISFRSLGSVQYGYFEAPPTGRHPTDPIEAMRGALIAARVKWPEVKL
jgi:hypothetical protein